VATRSAPPPLLRPRPVSTRRRSPWRALWAALIALAIVVVAVVAAVLAWSGASLGGDATALARVNIGPLGGTLERAQAFAPDGRRIPIAVDGGRLTPRTPLAPGERVSVSVVVRRPGWLGWALGHERHERLTVDAPVAHVTDRWLTVAPRAPVRVKFDQPVRAVAYARAGRLARRSLAAPRDSIALARRAPVGSVTLAVAARTWERLGAPVDVTWFPPSRSPVAVLSPGPGATIAPDAPLQVTFSEPVASVLGSARPRLSPAIAGHWRQIDDHTLAFIPSGFGAGLGGHLRLELPRAVGVTGPSGRAAHSTRQVQWRVKRASVLRLQQLLAQAGYLPVSWTPAGAPVSRTPRAEVRAAVDPPRGSFRWRYSNTPPELRALWSAGRPNGVTRGAVMMFEDGHGLTADGDAGPAVWRVLLADVIAGKRHAGGYSYVYVHENVPQSATLWHNGHTVITSPGNTGIPSAPTQLGTFPVFEHLPVGTMSGTNPDGSHYADPGIRYISYFNGGDALHAFNRASFGTPQSLGCVELPLAAAAKIFPYTPIGTLVTVEH
jgi:peptidoglycan hydrolase-like protein with peptidoglycan-binding domain